MIELLIDGQGVDVDQKTTAAITLTLAKVEDPSSSSSGYSKTIELPMTSRNRDVFGFTEQVHSKEQFNNSVHTGRIVCNGTTVLDGTVQMQGYKNNGRGGGSYEITLFGASYEWVKNAKKPLRELAVDDNGSKERSMVAYTLPEIYSNSVAPGNDHLLRFIPLDRGGFHYKEESDDKLYPRGTVDEKDYQPFFNMWNTLKAIFTGYTVESSLASTLNKVYFSGYMPQLASNEVLEVNKFLIGNRKGGEKLTISDNQQSDTKPINLFDTFEDESEASDKYFVTANEPPIIKLLPTSSDNGISYTAFSPTDSLVAAFEISLRFKTTVTYQSDSQRAPIYADTFIAYCNEVGGPTQYSQTYRFNAFDSLDGENKRYKNKYPDKNGDYILRLESSWNIGDKTLYESYLLVFRKPIFTGTGGWERDIHVRYYGQRFYLKNWEGKFVELSESRMYFTFLSIGDGLVFERNEEASLKMDRGWSMEPGESFPFVCKFAPSKRSLMHPGSSITVSLEGERNIKPDFRFAIGHGQELGAEQLGGDITQMQVIQAARQMFNLMFYTNPLSKTVYIEPRELFFSCELYRDFAGGDITLNIRAAQSGTPYDTAEYDFVVRLGNGSFELVGYTDGTKRGDFSLRRDGGTLTATIDASKTVSLSEGGNTLGVAAIHKATGTVELDEFSENVEIGVLVDWSEKLDYSQPIEITEIGEDVGNSLLLAYDEGNDVQKVYKRLKKKELGSYKVSLENKIADEPLELRNPIWSAPVMKSVDSMGMTVIKNVPDTEEPATIDAVDTEITPVVCQLVGIERRTNGGDTLMYPNYPLVSFQSAEHMVNLGFDDITTDAGPVDGLSRYYRSNVRMYNYGRRITCHIKLEPMDVEPIIYPNRQRRDFRALYRLRLDGEDVLCRLESINDYNPVGGKATKCVFVKE